MKIGILSFTEGGFELQQRISQIPGVEACQFKKSEQPAKEFVKWCFSERMGIIFIGAAGIAVRLIAPFLQSKALDPPVLVIDEKGTYVISLLSGHLGGANALAKTISREIGAQPVITTATDVRGIFSVDDWCRKTGCTVVELPTAKKVSAALLNAEPVGFYSDFPFSSLPDTLQNDNCPLGIAVSLDDTVQPFSTTLHVVPNIVIVGVGCRKGTDADVFERFLLDILRTQRISLRSVQALASIDLKKDESCILAFCNKYQVNFYTYSARELFNVKGTFQASAFVEQVTGVDNVCERSALAAIDGDGTLILGKQSSSGVTAALAMKQWRCEF